jgi:hypothetical protein
VRLTIIDKNSKGPTYLLLHSGRLIGPFCSRETALRWAALVSARAYSTYGPVRPEEFETELMKAD